MTYRIRSFVCYFAKQVLAQGVEVVLGRAHRVRIVAEC